MPTRSSRSIIYRITLNELVRITISSSLNLREGGDFVEGDEIVERSARFDIGERC